jgi:hypothetical protein
MKVPYVEDLANHNSRLFCSESCGGYGNISGSGLFY